MKKILYLVLTITLLFSLSISSSANSNTVTSSVTSVEYFEDGSYLETTIITSTPAVRSGVGGTKRLTYKNSDGDVQWIANLTGEFTYTGSSATCTKSSITYSIEDGNWKIPSATATKSGNTATGNVTAKYYFWGIPTKTVNEVITLTCSATGVLS